MIKAIIFDLNGIFVQGKLLSERIREKYGIQEDKFLPILKKVMSEARKPGNDDTFKLWQPRLKQIGLNIGKEEFFNFWFSGEKVNREALMYANKLREKGIRLFILSNNFIERTAFYRKNFPEIFKSVDGAYFSWETGFVKPDEQAYLNLLKENHIIPKECLYFDDSEGNLEVARNLGITSEKWESLESSKKIVESLTPNNRVERK